MKSAHITWTPNNVSSQRVEYKLHSNSLWNVYSIVEPSVNHIIITGLESDLVYDFRVVIICSGVDRISEVKTFSTINCVTYSAVITENSIIVSAIGKSIASKYKYILYTDNENAPLLVHDLNGPFVDGETYVHTFDDLEPGTLYRIKTLAYIDNYVRSGCLSEIYFIPQLYYYWGTTDTNVLPTEIEITTSILKNTMSSSTLIECDFTSINFFKYWWIAIKSTEDVKNVWSGEEIDNIGTIGTNQNLFKSIQVVGDYNVYMSNYKTKNTLSLITLIAT